MQLNREVDVSRGCVLEKDSGLTEADSFRAEILWMDDTELTVGKNFMVLLGTKKIPGVLTKIDYRIDINTGKQLDAEKLTKNEIAVCELAVTEPIVIDKFAHHRVQGEFILIDRISNMTAACGVVRAVGTGSKVEIKATDNMRSALNWQQPLAVVFRSGSDEEKLAVIKEAEYNLVRNGRHTYLYIPKADEDYQNVTNHLLKAGIVVLLVLSSQQDTQAITKAKEWTDIANDEVTSSTDIAAAVLQATVMKTVLTPNNWSI